MESLVTLQLVKRIAAEVSQLTLEDTEAGRLLNEMEIELRDILFSTRNYDDASLVADSKFAKFIEIDPVYADALVRFIRGRIPSWVERKVPYIASTLFVKHVRRWAGYETRAGK